MASTGEAGRFRVPSVVVLILGLVVLTGAAATLRPERPDDAYLWFADADFVGHFNAKMVDGIPRAVYTHKGETEPRTNPFLVAAWGLEHYSRGDTDTALRAAQWLVEHQEPGGVWRYDFSWTTTEGETLTPGWISGLAQGVALSLLTRAWHLTDDPAYLTTARNALQPFGRTVESGGVLRFWKGLPFYEEYPTPESPSLVLNGFLFTLIGLREYGVAADDADALRLWRTGERTASAIIGEYAVGAHDSSYALAYRYHDQTPDVVSMSPTYPEWHVDLARAMHELTGREVYARMSDRWEPNVPPGAIERGVNLLIPLVAVGALVTALALLVRRLGALRNA